LNGSSFAIIFKALAKDHPWLSHDVPVNSERSYLLDSWHESFIRKRN